MRTHLLFVAGVIALAWLSASTRVQGAPQPVKFLATNNSGFLQNGPGGPDNLVFFEVTPAPPIFAIPQIDFLVVGDLTLGLDANGDGADDSIGSFSGLEWSTGMPGTGVLIGCVLNEGQGNGEVYRINPLTAVPVLIGQAPLGPTGDRLAFSDLAFNPADGLMYGLMNDITDDGTGDPEFGNNTLWVDTNGDLVPDARLGDEIRTAAFCFGTLQTLASGLAFDDFGRIFIYDSLEEEILMGGGVNSSNLALDPCAVAFDNNETNLTSSELTQGNGLTEVNKILFIGTDAVARNTFVSYYEIPDPGDMPDPEPEVFTAGVFAREFFQTSFFASVAIGDLVGAEAELSDLPAFFPDSVFVTRGMPGKNATLESLAVSDDIYYCMFSGLPFGTDFPVDMEFVYTLPDPAGLTALGIEIERHANTTGLNQIVFVYNVSTENFDAVDFSSIPMDDDEVTSIDLTLALPNYVDPDTGTLRLRFQSRAFDPVLFFPWQIKFDSVLVLAE